MIFHFVPSYLGGWEKPTAENAKIAEKIIQVGWALAHRSKHVTFVI
jgi:hypothetical protein